MAHQGNQPPRKEMPIFSKQKFNFTPNYPITHLCVSNNSVAIAMQNKVILRIDLKTSDQPEEIDLKQHQIDAKLSNMFLDPSGQHMILTFSPKDSVNPAEVMYLGPKPGMKPKDIPALKTHIITAVAWNQDIDSSTPTSTSPFLLATSKGSIFEADVTNGDVKNAKQVYDIGKGSPAVISGLEYFFIPKSNKCVILVATSKRLYQFKGDVTYREDRPWFNNVFNSYLNQTSDEDYKDFGSISPPGLKFFSDHAVSRLHVYYTPGLAFPTSIGYLTDNGIMVYNETLKGSTSTDGEDDFLTNMKAVSYPKSPQDDVDILNSGSNHLPKSVVTTDYHVLLLYKGHVKAVCVLNDEVIFEDIYDEGKGRVMNIIRDPVRGSMWCFSERMIFKYVITDEERNIWRIFLDQGNFIKSQEFSKHDQEKMEVISMKQADHCFANKEYDMSAMYYAMTKASFEEIALKFVQVDDSHALKTFLMKKMSSLKSNDLAKTTALVLWLIEIFLNELGSLRDFGKQATPDYHNLEDEFLQFMAQPLIKECVSKNKKAVYDLMASHGDKENLIHFTLVMKDYDEVIENNIANGQCQAALDTLLKQKDASLYSRFIPTLLDKDSKATIDVLITAGRMLNPIKLLPKFSSKLEPDIATQVTRYLEHCVNNFRIQDQTLHDYLVSLYIHYFSSDKLMEYLKHQGKSVHSIQYDPKYALMMCLDKQLHYPSIHLYTLMGLYEEAVVLAIQVDLGLAKEVANSPEDDIEMKKKLWLIIAKHVVKEKNDIQQAMEFLQQCDLLKIEDILPFFPDFVTIDHFKDAICSSLQEYNQHIQNLKYEMDEATKSAEIITEEIQTVRNRCAIVRATDQCTVCETVLLIRNFYVFPCGHKFHVDCLLSEVYPTLTEPRKKILHEHQKKLRDLTSNHEIMSTGSATISARDQTKSDLDDIVASECIYCGDTMIKLVDTPFIPEDDYDRILREWE